MEHLIDGLCVYKHVTWGGWAEAARLMKSFHQIRGEGVKSTVEASVTAEDKQTWGGRWKKGCNGAAGGSPGLLINELVGCSPRLASDSHCPQSGLICLSPLYTQIICRLLLDCVFSCFIICYTHTHTKNNTREFHHELLEGS